MADRIAPAVGLRDEAGVALLEADAEVEGDALESDIGANLLRELERGRIAADGWRFSGLRG
jgi:hypothetical protein